MANKRKDNKKRMTFSVSGLLFLAIVVFIILILWANFFVDKIDEGGSIGGYITKSEKPVSNLLLVLYEGSIDRENEISSITTNVNGYYNFHPLKPGLYHILKADSRGAFNEITYNLRRQTSGIYLEKDETIRDFNYDIDWPSNYQDFPGKYKDYIDQYNGQPLQQPIQQPVAIPTPTVTMPKLEADNIVVIPELGIKMQITDDISDLIYTIDYIDKDDISVSFSTTSLTNIDQGCSPMDGPDGGILRTTSYHSSGENVGEAKKIGNYYYAIITPQADCTYNSHNENEGYLMGKLETGLRRAYQTMQPL